jgi:hypothetical protein
MVDMLPEELSSIQGLQAELEKTSVISDSFKDFIIFAAIGAATEGHQAGGAEVPELHEEYLNRRFSDKTMVRLGVQNIVELMEKVKDPRQTSGLAQFISKMFPGDDGVARLLVGKYDDVTAVRDWLWRAIDENSEEFAKMVGLGEWS